MLKQRSCFEMGAKSQTRGFSLKLSKTLQMFIFWNCSPNFCIQVRDSASQGSVLQSWQHCPSAGPACSISWYALHRDAWRLAPAHPTEHNSGNCQAALYLVRRWKKWTMGICDGAISLPWQPLFELVGSPSSGNCLWEGPGELQSSLSVWCRGEWEQDCTVFPSITQLDQPLAVNSGNSQAQMISLCPQPSLGSSVSWNSVSKLKMHGEREI